MRFTRPFVPLIGFMLTAWIILFLVADLYLIPALRVAQGRTRLPEGNWRRSLRWCWRLSLPAS